MKLADAMLCLDCEEVFALHEVHGDHYAMVTLVHSRCPSCANAAFAPLAPFVNGQPKEG